MCGAPREAGVSGAPIDAGVSGAPREAGVSGAPNLGCPTFVNLPRDHPGNENGHKQTDRLFVGAPLQTDLLAATYQFWAKTR